MKLLIVRHGDPDYAKDSLTEKGWREARYLSERLIKMGIDDFYVSPLGRARATASFTLDRLGQTAEVKDWLQEFPARIQEPSRPGEQKIAWDWLPEDWTKEELILSILVDTFISKISFPMQPGPEIGSISDA